MLSFGKQTVKPAMRFKDLCGFFSLIYLLSPFCTWNICVMTVVNLSFLKIKQPNQLRYPSIRFFLFSPASSIKSIFSTY